MIPNNLKFALTHTYKCSSHPSLRKLLLPQMETITKITPIKKMQSCGAQPQNTSTEHSLSQGSGNIVEQGIENCKSQRIREFTVIVCLLVVSEVTPIKSHQYDCLNRNWRRMTPINMPKWMGTRPWSFNLTDRTIDKRGVLILGETVFPGEEHTNWLFNYQTDSSQSMNTSNMQV